MAASTLSALPRMPHTKGSESLGTTAPLGTTARMRWLGRALIAAGAVMIPWLFVLATQLPSSTRASHWNIAWVGLDTFEATGLFATGVLLVRRDPRRCLTAAATAMLLVVDAWFDVTTAARGFDETTAIAMAVFLEVPIALLCTVLAVRALPRQNAPVSR
jgi:hypothetical protein